MSFHVSDDIYVRKLICKLNKQKTINRIMIDYTVVDNNTANVLGGNYSDEWRTFEAKILLGLSAGKSFIYTAPYRYSVFTGIYNFITEFRWIDPRYSGVGYEWIYEGADSFIRKVKINILQKAFVLKTRNEKYLTSGTAYLTRPIFCIFENEGNSNPDKTAEVADFSPDALTCFFEKMNGFVFCVKDMDDTTTNLFFLSSNKELIINNIIDVVRKENLKCNVIQ